VIVRCSHRPSATLSSHKSFVLNLSNSDDRTEEGERHRFKQTEDIKHICWIPPNKDYHSVAMTIPAWLVPLMGLLGLLTIVAFVELAVPRALRALQLWTIRDDFLLHSLVSEAAMFKCGLIELARGKASVKGIEKQMQCKIVPQFTKGRRVQCSRVFAVVLTLAMAVVGEYLVFFAAQKTRVVGRISNGVQMISFDGVAAAGSFDPSEDCAIIDERSVTENSMTQYLYESCLLSLDSSAGSNHLVNKDLHINFSKNQEGNIVIAMESQGRAITNMILLDYVTTFEYQRVAVGYKRSLKPFVDIFSNGFGCTLQRENLVNCGDRTQDEVGNISMLASKVLMRSASKRMTNSIVMLQKVRAGEARKLENIDRSVVRYVFVNEIGNARGISLIVLSVMGFLVWCFRMMTVSEVADMIRAYEAEEGYSASTVYGMERQQKELMLHVDSLSGQGHLAREPVNPDRGVIQDLGGRKIVTGGRGQHRDGWASLPQKAKPGS
jgi:hypothetical protein